MKVASAAPWLVAASALVGSYVYLRSSPPPDGLTQCSQGFEPRAHRCCPMGSVSHGTVGSEKGARYTDVCGDPPACPSPLVQNEGRCDAPVRRVLIPATARTLAASDWEAEGKVGTMDLKTPAFAIDAFEITVGQATCATCALPDPARFQRDDRFRAMSGLSREEAMRVCAHRGGRLPTETEWVAAALSGLEKPARYPWGDTGAVCRRDSWGLVSGPCAQGALLPDSVAAHADGATATGVHNLSGNVSEWVVNLERPNEGITRGGSFESAFAADLRIWRRRLIDPNTRSPALGARCVYEGATL
jgi:formylglycine-generating enzyme